MFSDSFFAFFFFHFIEDLKAKYPSKDWAQIRGRLLGICNMTSEDVSLNKAVNKVCLGSLVHITK